MAELPEDDVPILLRVPFGQIVMTETGFAYWVPNRYLKMSADQQWLRYCARNDPASTTAPTA